MEAIVYNLDLIAITLKTISHTLAFGVGSLMVGMASLVIIALKK